MAFEENNITIVQTSGYNPSFSWQVGFNSLQESGLPLNFRATVRPLNGFENYTRIPSPTILYEETGLVIDASTNRGSWSFPLAINATISGGPFRDYQVVIEAHDKFGNTSAGNLVETSNENGWVAFNQGYDVLAVSNPRQTGIELGSSIPTQPSLDTGYYLGSDFQLHSGAGYGSFNYMDTNGGINIIYTSGTFNSNLVGGYIYAWTGQFPKVETAIYTGNWTKVARTRFDFDPKGGHIFHPTAAGKFRGSSYVYISLSFYDNLDAIAIENGIDISTGLYLSDNAIAYNDVSAGSVTLGSQSIYSLQYAGYADPNSILGADAWIVSKLQISGITTVLYTTTSLNMLKYPTYAGSLIGQAGGLGGNSILVNHDRIKNS